MSTGYNIAEDLQMKNNVFVRSGIDIRADISNGSIAPMLT